MHPHQYDDERVVILTPLVALCVLPYFDVAAHGSATVNRLVERFRQTALAAHKADQTLIANILEHSTPAQRKQLQAALKRANQQYDKVVGD